MSSTKSSNIHPAVIARNGFFFCLVDMVPRRKLYYQRILYTIDMETNFRLGRNNKNMPGGRIFSKSDPIANGTRIVLNGPFLQNIRRSASQLNDFVQAARYNREIIDYRSLYTINIVTAFLPFHSHSHFPWSFWGLWKKWKKKVQSILTLPRGPARVPSTDAPGLEN